MTTELTLGIVPQEDIKRLLGCSSDEAKLLRDAPDEVNQLFSRELEYWSNCYLEVYPGQHTAWSLHVWLDALADKKWGEFSPNKRLYAMCRRLRAITLKHHRAAGGATTAASTTWEQERAILTINAQFVRTSLSLNNHQDVHPRTGISTEGRWGFKHLVFSVVSFFPSDDPMEIDETFRLCAKASGRCRYFEDAIKGIRAFFEDDSICFY